MNYICTHKDFTEYVTEGDYTILSTAKLNNTYSFPVVIVDNDLEPLKKSYSEGYMIKQIYLNLIDNCEEWIGVNHYRRYFNNPTDETTLPIPYKFNMHTQYAACHNINDLLKVEEIIDTYFPEYSTDYANINILFQCNIFIMKRSDFICWYNFVFGVLKHFSIDNGLYTDDDVRKYVECNRNQYKQFEIDYQSRLHGFLMERLTTIFILKRFKDKEVVIKPIITI